MATSLFPDPLQFWRDAVTKLEGDINSLATGSLKSQQVLRSLHRLSSASTALQQIVERAIEAHLRRANLPSRKQVSELAESLRRIEEKLDGLLPAKAETTTRPARTRRPAVTPPVADTATPKRGRTRSARS